MTEWIVTSSALILVVIALRGLLKQRLRPMVRYALWALVLIRLLLPFSIAESFMSLGNVTADIGQQAGAAVERYETSYDRVIQQYEHAGITVTPSQARDEARQQMYTDTYQSISDRYAQEGVTVPEAQIQQEAQRQTDAVSLLALVTEALPVIWHGGMALMALALLGSNAWFAWKLRRSSTPISQPGFPLPVYETHYAATPCLFGLVRPGVYLTAEAAGDSVMRRHVLAHELTHYRHGDHIWSLLRGVCLVAHWYNPLVWAAALLSRQDAELACDEAAIRVLGEDERTAYGKTLIGMTCVRHDPKSFLVTATTMTGSKKALKDRVRAIARKPKNALYAVIACVLVLSIAAGCTFTGSVNTELTKDEAWERVLAAVETYNNRRYYHLTVESFYDFVDDTLDGGLINEFYQAGGNEFRCTTVSEQTEQILFYNGSMLVSVENGDWNALGTNNRATDLSFGIPAEDNLVLSWEYEGRQLVVVCDYSYQEPDEYANMDPTVTFWIDPGGRLSKYVYRYGVDQDTSTDYIHTVTVTVHADDAGAVNQEILNVYSEAAAVLGLGPGETVPTPTGYPGGQLQRSLIWYGGSLYINIAEVPGESVPDRYHFYNLISHEDPTAIPDENFHACHVPVGTSVYIDPDDSSYIYYWEQPHEDHLPRRMQRFDLTGLSISDLTGDPMDDFLVLSPNSLPDSPGHLFPFIYSNDPDREDLREHIGPNSCQDGYLYVQDRTTMAISQVLDMPVERYAPTRSHLFCVTQDGRIIQTDYTGRHQRTIYQAAGEISDIYCRYAKVYFNDGTDLIILDLDTMTAAVVGNFPDYRTIYAASETWLWLNISGADYGYDTVTKESVRFQNYEELNRFLEGEWPAQADPDTVQLPENYTLADVVTTRTETISWTDDGEDKSIQYHFPVITPFSEDAILLQDLIDAPLVMVYEDELSFSSDTHFMPHCYGTTFEASLNDGVVSILTQIPTSFGISMYAYNLDTVSGNMIGAAEMARRYLSISYPEFLMAVCEYRMDELQAAYPDTDVRAYMAEFTPDAACMDTATLYLDAGGNICLRYHSLELGGAVFYHDVTPFSLEQVDWDPPSREEAYAWLFGIEIPSDFSFEGNTSDYWAMIRGAYFADPEEFLTQLSRADEATQQRINKLLLVDDPSEMESVFTLHNFFYYTPSAQATVTTTEDEQTFHIATADIRHAMLDRLDRYTWSQTEPVTRENVVLSLHLEKEYDTPQYARRYLEITLYEDGSFIVNVAISGAAEQHILTPKQGTDANAYDDLTQLIRDHVSGS